MIRFNEISRWLGEKYESISTWIKENADILYVIICFILIIGLAIYVDKCRNPVDLYKERARSNRVIDSLSEDYYKFRIKMSRVIDSLDSINASIQEQRIIYNYVIEKEIPRKYKREIDRVEMLDDSGAVRYFLEWTERADDHNRRWLDTIARKGSE